MTAQDIVQLDHGINELIFEEFPEYKTRVALVMDLPGKLQVFIDLIEEHNFGRDSDRAVVMRELLDQVSAYYLRKE